LRQCAACPAAGATSRGNRRPPAPGSPLQRVLRRSWRRNRTADRSWSRRPASRRHVPPDRPPVRRRIPPPAMPPPAKRGRAKPPSAAFRPVFPCSPVAPPNHSIVFNRNHYYFHRHHTISAPRCQSPPKTTKNTGPARAGAGCRERTPSVHDRSVRHVAVHGDHFHVVPFRGGENHSLGPSAALFGRLQVGHEHHLLAEQT